jgi:hypothetical protein
MTPRTRSDHGRDTQQVPRGNLLVGACRLVLELTTSGAVLLNGSAIAQAQSLIANALPPGSPAYLKETWRSALHAPMPLGDFCDRRFSIGLSSQEKIDLVSFLNSL